MTPVYGLVLSGGASRRMGQPKALLTIDGRTLLAQVVDALSMVCEAIYVVTGAHTHRIRANSGVEPRWVDAPNWRRGMRASLRAGLLAMPAGHVLLTHVDRPPVDPITLQLLTAGHRAHPRVPIYRGRPGHPVLLPNWLRSRLLETDDTPLRDVLRRAQLRRVATPDSRVLDNLNDRPGWRRYQTRVSKEVRDPLHR